MKTLLYIAAGNFHPNYHDLPFDKMYFVEKNDIEFKDSYPNNNEKIIYMGMDALLAIDKLKQQKVIIDNLVSLNEGLNEGGGGYPILSDQVMGYLSPLLKDEFILICDFSHYAKELQASFAQLDWGFKKQQLLTSDSSYIDPRIFSMRHSGRSKLNFGNVFKMQRIKNSKQLVIPNSQIEVFLNHGSIWDNEKKLDFIGLSLRDKPIYGAAAYNSLSPTEFFEKKDKVYNIHGKTFKEIIAHCELQGLKRIGLCPWNNGNYDEVIKALPLLGQSSIKQISFYHLNKNDFSALYALQ